MKRFLALALCLCFALGGCGEKQSTGHSEDYPAPTATENFDSFALRLAALPELPPEPDENALWAELDKLDYDRLGEEAYWAAYQALIDDHNAQYHAYQFAVQTLHGNGVDAALTPPLTVYTLCTARQMFENAGDKNVVYSPANLYLALCMLAETTDGDSRAQLLDLLGLDSVEQARGGANALWRNLYKDGNTGKTILANSIWLSEQLDFHMDAVDTLADSYYASTFRAPMGDKATDAAIAQWIDENTNGLLSDAAAALQTKPETLLMLISTLYFKGTWSDQFAPSDTYEDAFTNANGGEQRVDFMHKQDERREYYRRVAPDYGFTAASLPFRDGTSMWFLLPDEGTTLTDTIFAELPRFVDTGGLETPDPGFEQGYADIHWSVPKFDVSSDLDLIPTLQALGVTDVFDPDAADFSPLTDLEAVVSAVKHAARVKVDEDGCEAAAFTSIMVTPTAMMPEDMPVIEMNLNRPFGFLITGADGLPLFTGVVNTME